MPFWIKVFLLSFLISSEMHAQRTVKARVLKARVTEFPPQYYQDKDKKWIGLDVELTRALVKEAGFEVEFVVLPWQRALKDMANGALDLILGFGISEERKDYALWLGPMRDAKVALAVKKGHESMRIQSLDDMKNICKTEKKKFSYQRGAFWSTEFNERFAKDKDFASCFETISEVEQHRKMTLADRTLGFFEISLSLEYLVHNDPNFKGLAIHPFVLDDRPTFWGVSKKNVSSDELVKLFKAYETLTKNGTFDRIRVKWRPR